MEPMAGRKKGKEKIKKPGSAARGFSRRLSRRSLENKAREFYEIKKMIDGYLNSLKSVDLNLTVGG
jgi:hypothetical protein